MKHFRKDRAKPAQMVKLLRELQERVMWRFNPLKMQTARARIEHNERAQRLLLHWWHTPRKMTVPIQVARRVKFRW